MRTLELRDVYKSYGKNKSVLRGFSMRVPEGAAIAMLGQLGSGKTTVLRLLAGLEAPQKGAVHRGLRTSWIMPGHSFFSNGTGIANTRFAARFYGMDEDLYLRAVMETSEIGALINQNLGKLSVLQRGQLAMAMALCLDADVYLFDEYTGYGTDSFRARCGEIIRALVGRGRTVVIASSLASVVLPFCTESYCIDNGAAVHHSDLNDGLAHLAAMPPPAPQTATPVAPPSAPNVAAADEMW